VSTLTVAEISDLYKRIASVTTRLEFTSPVADDDLVEFARQLRDVLPFGFVTRLTRPRVDRVGVEVLGPTGRVHYGRTMLVSEAPQAAPVVYPFGYTTSTTA
jgi:hypothetical protein